MSEDKNSKEQRAATQTVANAQVDDAIGEKAPREIRKSQDEDDASIASQKLARGDNSHMPSETDTNATKRGYGPFHGNSSNWPPSPKEAEVEVDGRASSDNEGARKDDAIDLTDDPAGEDTDVEDSHEVAHQDWRAPDDPFEKDDMVFVKFNYGHAWYAGSIYKRYPSGDDGDFVYEVYTYMNEIFKKVPKSRLLLFTKEEFECMYSRHAGHTLCLFYAAREFNCDCAPEDWIDLKRPGLRELQELNVPDKLINRVCSTPWCKDLVKRFEAALLKRRESVEGTRP